jgi:hypothetical protein
MYLNRNLRAGITLKQAVILIRDATYELNFSLAGLDQHPGGTLFVSIGSTPLMIASTPDSSSAWVQKATSFSHSSDSGWYDLTFTSATTGAINIDNVSLVMTAVPEPDTWLLLGAGMVLVPLVAARSRPASS